MKIAVHIARSLLGLMFLWASVAYFFNLMPQEAPPASVQTYMAGIMSVHLLTIVKSIELVCGVLLLTNLFAPLANVLLFPITVNIVIMHIFLDPKTAPIAIAILAIQLFLAYAYRRNYAGLLNSKPL
jgi:putative oxidoreductase